MREVEENNNNILHGETWNSLEKSKKTDFKKRKGKRKENKTKENKKVDNVNKSINLSTNWYFLCEKEKKRKDWCMMEHEAEISEKENYQLSRMRLINSNG